MEINFGSNRIGGIGAGYGMGDAADVGKASNRQVAKNVSFTPPEVDALRRSEPVAEIPDAALSRDDDLGKLVNAAFNLPPPPMPTFGG